VDNLYEPIVWYIVFLFSVTLHEAAHAFIAKIGGDDTAYLGGQVSLDPIPHIRRSPFGMVVIPVISLIISGWPIGFASAPYDPYWADRYPRRAGYMALAGPASNFLLVILAAIVIRLGLIFGVFTVPSSIRFADVAMATQSGIWSGVAFIVGIIFTLNLVLGILNLIPVPPLDGSSVITIFMSEDAARRLNAFFHNSTFAILGILIAWRIFGIIFRPLFIIAINLLYPEGNYS
jgi:Zn-dependent protease